MKQVQHLDTSTEEKIKEAARKIFTQKGYAATRTMDIAEEAGINKALLNYYFRSKEKLFQIIMVEKVQQLFGTIAPILNDSSTDLETKINMLASSYLEMLSENPDLPLFVLSEIKTNPQNFKDSIPIEKVIERSYFIKQLKEKRPDINPLHFLLNLLSMSIFPFIVKPVLMTEKIINEKSHQQFIKERKKLIPLWMKAILKAK